MGLTKYASLEVSEVLDIKGTRERAKTASLEKLGEFGEYRTEDGYLYARIRAISSRVNKNNDGWPSVELAGGPEVWERFAAQRESSKGGFVVEADTKEKYGYSTFLGKPVFVDHHNSDPKKARGVIVDAKLHVEDHKTASDLDPYYATAPEEHTPPTWVELLLEIDAKSFPRLAKAIVEGSQDPNKGIDGFSMGCDVEKSVCSICKNAATSPEEYCNHVKLKGATFDAYDEMGKKTSKKAYEDCYGIKFFEISAVFDPADETALLREIRASVKKEANDYQPGDRVRLRNGPQKETTILDFSGVGYVVGDPEAPDAATRVVMPDEIAPAEGFELDQFSELPGTENAGFDFNAPIQTTDHPLGPNTGKIAKTAGPTIHPQGELTKAPDEVNTLRKELVCRVCGQDVEGTECSVCGWEPPPQGLDNPDLDKAQERRDRQSEGLLEGVPDEEGLGVSPEGLAPDTATEGLSPLRARSRRARNSNLSEKVTSEMAWEPIITPRLAAVLAERQSDEPVEEVVKDETQPVTAQQITEDAVGASKTAGEPADPSGKPDKQVDVLGVGGVADASNEQASKADKQVDVLGKGGTGVEDVSADETQSIAETADDNAGFDKTKTTEDSGKTKTFDLPSNHLDAGRPHDGGAFPKGGAKTGTDPVDAVGKPDERVDLEQEVSVSWNGGDTTDQWTGTDGNGVTKQQSPVTRDVDPNIDVRSSAVLFAALKLADQEVDLGLISKETKYDRIAELERKSPETLRELHAYLGKVRTAGLSRQNREARRVPSLASREAAAPKPEVTEPVADQLRDDSALFV